MKWLRVFNLLGGLIFYLLLFLPSLFELRRDKSRGDKKIIGFSYRVEAGFAGTVFPGWRPADLPWADIFNPFGVTCRYNLLPMFRLTHVNHGQTSLAVPP